MESVRKALWFMESRFRGEVSLDELSMVAGISRYHFAHVFAKAPASLRCGTCAAGD
jgi:AraC family transcriptional regulator